MITICLGTDVHNVFLFAGMHVRRLVTNGLIAFKENAMIRNLFLPLSGEQ